MEAVVVELTKNTVSTPLIEPVSKVTPVKEETEFNKDSENAQDAPVINVDAVDFSKLVSKVTEVVQKLGTKVSFSYDDRTPRPIIKVVDDESGEVIRQIPREEMLHLMSRLREVAGLIFEGSI